MKLYDVPRKSFIQVLDDDFKVILFFDHIDGMYSLCYDRDSNPVHLAAWADVVTIDKPEDFTDKFQQ